VASPKTIVKNFFKKLRHSDFSITSNQDTRYNCIAWAAEKSDRWWWPAVGYYWPPDFPLHVTVQNFLSVFATLGYTQCSSFDFEPGYDKVAIYLDAAGRPSHMARQLPDGMWTSKLGPLWDIAHKTLQGLEGTHPAYGTLAIPLKRPIVGAASATII